LLLFFIQVFQPNGQFLTAFGSWGSQDGQLKGLEAIAIYGGHVVASDRENHRLQLF
jgi:tripartite motif-containing protein 71